MCKHWCSILFQVLLKQWVLNNPHFGCVVNFNQWIKRIHKLTKTPLHVLSSLSVMTKAEQAKPQVTNQDTSTNPEGTNPSGTCKDQGPGTIQPRPRGLCQQRNFFQNMKKMQVGTPSPSFLSTLQVFFSVLQFI